MTAPLMKPREVATMLGVSSSWVYDAANKGRIPAVRLGGDNGPVRFDQRDVEEWLRAARETWTPGR